MLNSTKVTSLELYLLPRQRTITRFFPGLCKFLDDPRYMPLFNKKSRRLICCRISRRGCQFVSLNFTRNKYMLLNDGRFRVGGSTGYVLKPEYLCTNKPGVDIDDSLNCCNPKKITVRVLSGSCLPKSLDKKSSFSSYNPFVRVTLYDGSPGGTFIFIEGCIVLSFCQCDLL